jgi:phenylacetate-CoA ligase
MHEAFSGGSTGTPVRIYQSREYRHWHGAGRRRELTMCGPFRLGMALAFFWGRGIQSRAHRGVVGSFRDVLVNLLWFDAFSLRRDGMIDTIRRLRAYRPSFVVGYASILAEVARALDRPLEGVLAVESTAETLTPPDRLLIAQGFGAPIFDRYATNELGTLAHECQAHDGLHLVMENTILEIVDPGGRTLTDARAEGEVVVTNLRNLATPLVRYRLGDVARVGTAGCVCGRGSLRLEAVVGRSSDLISCPRGTLLHSLFFIKLFYGAPVRRFRVDQETPTRLRVRVVPGPAYTDEVRQRVTSLILTQGDPGFQVEWEIVEDIPPAPSGKFRVTVNHVVRATSGDSGNLTAG